MTVFDHLTTAGSIECPVKTRSISDPNAVAVRSGDEVLTYKQLDELIQARVASLAIKVGERVCFQPTQTIEQIVLYWALFRCHAVACPISTREPADVVTARVQHVSGLWLPDIDRESTGEIDNSQLSPKTRLRLNDASTIIFSSGSTAEPKAVVHDLRSHLLSAVGSNENIQLEPGDGWLLSLPTYHVGGIAILFRCAIAGACVVVPSAGSSLVESVANSHVTHISVVTTQLLRILAAGLDATHLKAVLLGGSAIPVELVQRARQEKLPIRTTYGMTEMASQVTTSKETPGEAVNAGEVLRFRRLSVAEGGEILVAGPTLCLGYWEQEQPMSHCDADGWFHTGDVGVLDGSILHVTGRVDNMFISGGENIHPEEIENSLLSFPGIRQAIVIPLTHSEFGFRPIAVVDIDDLDQEKITQHLRTELQAFKVPDAILPWPDADQQGLKPSRKFLAKYVAKLAVEQGLSPS